MPSRVVHVRLDDWALLGCHDILKSGGKIADDISMSTMVRQIVNALVRNMQLSDRIPTYTKEERYDRISEMYRDEPLALDIILDPSDIVEEKDEDDDIMGIVREAVRQIESEGEPKEILQEVEISEADPIQKKEETTINLLTQLYDPFYVFKKRAPKDRFIEWADEENEIVQAAVCVAYTGLPQDLWGSDKAEKIISDLIKRHRGDNGKIQS